MKRLFEYLVYLVVAVGCFATCNLPRKLEPNPEEQVIRELRNRRIVMLGDFAHEYPLSYYGLTWTLSAWITMLERGETDQNHLTLFLEEDQEMANIINKYLKTGNLNPFLDMVLPSTSLERLEFYSELRKIARRVDSLNAVVPVSKRITFDIQGPEEMSVFAPRMLDSSARATLLYYVRDRDSLAASNIIMYLKDRPDQKALIFYGVGHLIRNIIEKREFMGSLAPEERIGAYIAHYLKKEYGDSQVFTIAQLSLERSHLNLDESDAEDRLLTSSNVPWKVSPGDDENLSPKNFDAFLIRHGFVIQNHPLQCVYSTRVIASSLKRLEFSESHRSGAMGNRLYQEALRTLEFLYDTSFSSCEQWKSWCSAHALDGMKRIRSEDFGRHLANEGSKLLGRPEFFDYIDGLLRLGYDTRVGSPTMTVQEWNRDFDEMLPQIIVLNAIGIYWIGNSDEQSRAKEYLAEVSGKIYGEPDLYLKWWRRNYFKVKY